MPTHHARLPLAIDATPLAKIVARDATAKDVCQHRIRHPVRDLPSRRLGLRPRSQTKIPFDSILDGTIRELRRGGDPWLWPFRKGPRFVKIRLLRLQHCGSAPKLSRAHCWRHAAAARRVGKRARGRYHRGVASGHGWGGAGRDECMPIIPQRRPLNVHGTVAQAIQRHSTLSRSRGGRIAVRYHGDA